MQPSGRLRRQRCAPLRPAAAAATALLLLLACCCHAAAAASAPTADKFIGWSGETYRPIDPLEKVGVRRL